MINLTNLYCGHVCRHFLSLSGNKYKIILVESLTIQLEHLHKLRSKIEVLFYFMANRMAVL